MGSATLKKPAERHLCKTPGSAGLIPDSRAEAHTHRPADGISSADSILYEAALAVAHLSARTPGDDAGKRHPTQM